MNRTLRFFEWKEAKWLERATAMKNAGEMTTPEHDEGLSAYAERQAKLCRDLRDAFALKWQKVPDMMKRAKMEAADSKLLFERKEKEMVKILKRQGGAKVKSGSNSVSQSK